MDNNWGNDGWSAQESGSMQSSQNVSRKSGNGSKIVIVVLAALLVVALALGAWMYSRVSALTTERDKLASEKATLSAQLDNCEAELKGTQAELQDEIDNRDYVVACAYGAGLYDASEVLKIGGDAQVAMGNSFTSVYSATLAKETDRMIVSWARSLLKGSELLKKLSNNAPTYDVVMRNTNKGNYDYFYDYSYYTSIYGFETLVDLDS